MQLADTEKPGSDAWETADKLNKLAAALTARDPQLPGHLAAIHAHLEQFPEMMHLLDPADFGTIIAAHKQFTNNGIVATKVKAAAKKPAAKIGISDLI